NFPIYRIIPEGDDSVPDDGNSVPDEEDSPPDDSMFVFIIIGVFLGSALFITFGIYRGIKIKKSKSIEEPVLGSTQKISSKTKSQDVKLYNESIRKNPTINQYLESNVSIDEIPNRDKLIAIILKKKEIQKINAIDLPTEDKKKFIMEILSLSSKDRKAMLNELLKKSK
ncbi:MAG: hypothetical protein JW891_15885, partial [Candidatus Lokiarchaeota archaeon]|nr:hypothetical protein [Candidatus Lokiarchaeota archaeon]